MSTFRVELLLRFNPASLKAKTPLIIPIKSRLKLMSPLSPSPNATARKRTVKLAASPKGKGKTYSIGSAVMSKENSRMVMVVGLSVGMALLLMGFEDGKAMALGPEGPLMEDFWDNMRRYALYALTVSTGAIYALVEPIVELLKNPISAVLILLILGGGFFLVSQVVTAMVGLSDFSYDYNY